MFLQGLFLHYIEVVALLANLGLPICFLPWSRGCLGMVSKRFFWWNDPSGSTTNQAVAIFWSTKHLRFQRSDLDAIESGVLKRVKEQRQVGSKVWLIQAEFQISNTQMKIWNQTLQTCDMAFWMSSVSHSHILAGPFHFCPFGRRLGDGTDGDVGEKPNGNQVEWILWEVAFLQCGEFF